MSAKPQPITHPAVARAQVENPEGAFAEPGKRSQNALLDGSKCVRPYGPLLAVPAGNIFEREAQIVVPLGTPTPFRRTNEFILRDKLAEMIDPIGRECAPDTSSEICCLRTI